MKKSITLIIASCFLLVLSSCGKKESTTISADTAEAIQVANELGKAVADIKPIDANSKPEDVVQSVEKLAEIGAAFEVKEYEKTSPVDAPSNFPTELIYSKWKIINSSDNSSDEKNINQDIEIKTLDTLNDVKTFYKTALSASGWKIKNQSNSSNGWSYSASKEDGSYVDVDISGNEYSKIAEIQVNYSKSSN